MTGPNGKVEKGAILKIISDGVLNWNDCQTRWGIWKANVVVGGGVGGGVGHLPRSPPAVTVELFKNKKRKETISHAAL